MLPTVPGVRRPQGERKLCPLPSALFAGICLALLSVPALAQSADESSDSKAKSLDPVVILGSRRTNVTALTSAQPIDVVDAQKLEATGATTISEALQRSVPSFHFPQETPSTSVQYAVRGASLHGMAPDQVLILVNGQRYHRNSQLNTGYLGYGRGTQIVDIDSIPVSAIDRVEVLRDGASAQYGSDAIAGVINIILKKNPGGGVAATVGQFSKGDGLRREVEADYGFALPNAGFLHLAAVLGRTDPSDIAIDDTRQYYFSGDARESTVNRHWFYGSGEVKKAGFSFNGEMPINDMLTAYADGIVAYRKNYGFGTFRLPRDNNNVRAIYPDGFEPKQSLTSNDADLSAGLRLSDPEGLGNVDFNAQVGRNRSDIALWDTLNASMGVDSPTSGSAGSTVNTDINLSVNHTKYFAPEFMSSGITIGDGLSYRHERYEIVAGDPWTYIDGGVPVLDGPSAGTTTQQGSQSGSGFNANDAGVWTRHVAGAYLSATTTLFDRLDLDLSGRVEDYSDFGTTSTGKLSARFEFSPAFAIRGSASTGYRAPSIAQLYYTRTSGTIVSSEQKIIRILPADSAAAETLGAKPLDPEKSKNLSLGFVWQPTPNSVLTVDGYDIRVDDRIVLTGTLSGSYVSSVLAAAGYGELYGAQFFTNALDTRTRGLDAVYRYQVPHLAIGDLDFTLSYSTNRTHITHQEQTPAVLAAAGLSLVDRQQKAFIEHGTPDTKFVASAIYSIGRWTVSPSVVQYGKYAYYDTKNATLDQTFGKQWVANLVLGYRVSDHWNATLGANNLFNSHPDKQIVAERSPTVSEYSNLAPEGANGTWLYARVNYTF